MEQGITVAGFLLHKGKVLVVRRSKEERHLSGYYELPGGKVDFGEQPEDALKREFKEETGLTIQVKEPYRAFSFISQHKTKHTVEIVYKVRLLGNDTIKLSNEHDDHRWITYEETDNLQLSDEIKENIRQGMKQ